MSYKDARGILKENKPSPDELIAAAYALKGHESIVLIIREEAKRINGLGYTATSERLFKAAKKLDALFVEIDKGGK